MVNDRPIAAYGVGFSESTKQFVESFSGSYWEHHLELIGSVPKDSLTHDHVSLARYTLAHAEEHLFSLIFAYLQAPHCPDLWLYRYKTEDLIALTSRVESGGKIQSRFKLAPPTWEKFVRILWPSLDEIRAPSPSGQS